MGARSDESRNIVRSPYKPSSCHGRKNAHNPAFRQRLISLSTLRGDGRPPPRKTRCRLPDRIGYPHGSDKRFHIASDPPFPSFLAQCLAFLVSRFVKPQLHAFRAQLSHPHRRHRGTHYPRDRDAGQTAVGYANEAGLLNVALSRCAARQRRGANPTLAGEMRDHAAIERLSVMANLEGMNAELIQIRRSQGECLKRLNETSGNCKLAASPGARKLGPVAEKDE